MFFRAIRNNSRAVKLNNCALFDKSANFGRDIYQYNMNKFRCGAIVQMTHGGHGGHFQNGRELIQKRHKGS